jgi:hypothetical protein
VKKFEKRGPAEMEHKIKDYAVNNLKPLDFDLDLQCIDKGDNYRKPSLDFKLDETVVCSILV